MDSAYGRFTTVDPLAEKYPWISPYVYCNNNPIKYIDPNGMDWIKNDKTGDVEWRPDATKESTPKGWSYVGDTYMGFSITQGDAAEGSDGYIALETAIYYTNPEGEKNKISGWVQTVDTTLPLDGDGNPSIDPKEGKHDNFPYYHSQKETKDANYMAKQRKNADTRLLDRPSRKATRGDFDWKAETRDGYATRSGMANGQNHIPVITLSWGFYKQGGKIGNYPIQVVKPSIFHTNAINKVK